MQVIGAGYGRTGTMTLKAALEQLGAGPCFHMIDLIRNETRVELWEAAVAGEAGRLARGLRGLGGDGRLAGVQLLPAADGGLPGREGAADGARSGRLVRELPADDPRRPGGDPRRRAGGRDRDAALAGGDERDRAADLGRRVRGRASRIARSRWTSSTRTTRRCARPCPRTGSWCTRSRTGGSRWRGCSTSRCPHAPFPHLNDTAAFRAMMGMPALQA